MRISDWSSDVCSSDVDGEGAAQDRRVVAGHRPDRMPGVVGLHEDQAPVRLEGIGLQAVDLVEVEIAVHQVDGQAAILPPTDAGYASVVVLPLAVTPHGDPHGYQLGGRVGVRG